MNKSLVKVLGIMVLVAVVVGGVVLVRLHSSTQPASESLKKVTIGIQTSPAMALVMVAKEKGFFAQEGLDVEIKEFTAGKFALEAFLGGSLDFSVSGDVPLTLASLQGNKFVVPAQVVKKTVSEVRVVARKDGDLNNPADYFKTKKRKLATSIGGGPEFFTYEFLNKLGITKDQVEIVSQAPADMPAALSNGSVDAIAVFDPFAFIGEKQLGDKSVTFKDESIYSELYVLEAKESVKQNPADLEKLIKGLIGAEKFTRDNPEQAKQVVMKYTKLDKSTLDGIWGSFDFQVALTSQLNEYLSREVQWAKAVGKVKSDTATPNFKEIVWDHLLKTINPAAVQ
jgi:NitT/TauT family transport system substrate-binding protein